MKTHPFSSHNLVIMRAQRQPARRPRIEVIRRRDGAAGSVRLPHTPVLIEGGRALDARLVDALRAVDVVRGPVAGDGPKTGSARTGVVGAEVLDNVVLDQRIGGPPVDREVRIAVGGVGARVRNVPVVLSDIGGIYFAAGWNWTDLALPGFQPLPPTKFPYA